MYGKDPSMGIIQQEEIAQLQDDLAKKIEVAIIADDSELQKELAETGRQLRLQTQRQAPVDTGQLRKAMASFGLSVKEVGKEINEAAEVLLTKTEPVERFSFKKGISKKEE